SDASAENVGAPTRCVAPLVSTGMTYAPASIMRRHSSTALYAAMPPLTPRTTRCPSRPPMLMCLLDRFLGVVGAHEGDLVRRDLLEGDRQRLPGHRRDLRGHNG